MHMTDDKNMYVESFPFRSQPFSCLGVGVATERCHPLNNRYLLDPKCYIPTFLWSTAISRTLTLRLKRDIT